MFNWTFYNCTYVGYLTICSQSIEFPNIPIIRPIISRPHISKIEFQIHKVWHDISTIHLVGPMVEMESNRLNLIQLSHQYHEYLVITCFNGSIHLLLVSFHNKGLSFSTLIIIIMFSMGVLYLSSNCAIETTFKIFVTHLPSFFTS